MTVRKIVFEGKWEWVIFFLLLFLPFYISVLSISLDATKSNIVLTFFKVVKELILFVAILAFFVYKRNFFDYEFRLNVLDKLMISFFCLGLFFVFFPIGQASFTEKLSYYKNLLMMGVMYFLGRNTHFYRKEVNYIFYAIYFVIGLAFIINIFETFLGMHFQSISGYSYYNKLVNNMEPSGNYELSWTFETQSGSKRLAAFFGAPLELAAVVMLSFSAGLIWFLTNREEKRRWLAVIIMIISVLCLFFAASRSSFLGFIIMLFFISFVFRLKWVFYFGLGFFSLFATYILLFANRDLYFFVIDTLTFENPSSAGHVVEWLIAWNSMLENPLGNGLAMSGNVGAVDDLNRIGGENQFLVIGAQMGFLGMIMYIMILFYSIKNSLTTFRNTDNIATARLAFIASTVKFGMLLPLFTANAETYIYLAWATWWMVGYCNKCIYYSESI